MTVGLIQFVCVAVVSSFSLFSLPLYYFYDTFITTIYVTILFLMDICVVCPFWPAMNSVTRNIFVCIF